MTEQTAVQANAKPRAATIERRTAETDIRLALTLDSAGQCAADTPIGFLNHMLAQVARHGFMDIRLTARGDTEVDCHHLVEDIGIVLGKALAQALGDKAGIRRYGDAAVPMEDALIQCVLDVSGRPYLAFDAAFTVPVLGTLDTEMIEEFLRAVCLHGGLNLHVRLLAGHNNHHIAEAMFKAFGRALAQAVGLDPRVTGVLSTKGMLEG